MEMDAYEGQPLDPKTNKANIVLKKKTFGGVPPGAGMREDVMLIFEELEEARNVRSQIQALTEFVPEPKIQIGKQLFYDLIVKCTVCLFRIVIIRFEYGLVNASCVV